MPGRAPWSTAGSKGSGETVATNEVPVLVSQDETQTGTVAAGSTEQIEVYAPQGSVYEVSDIRMVVSVPSGATTGTHLMNMTSFGGAIKIITGQSDYTDGLRFDWMHWQKANDTALPPTQELQAANARNAKAGDQTSLTFRYENGLDADTTDKREYVMRFQRYDL